MKIEPRDGTTERHILCHCITSTAFLARVAGRLGKDPFRSKDGNQLWSWCEKHLAKYHTAPDREIERIYAAWAANGADKDTATRIERLLSSLSEEYGHADKVNLDFALDQAEKYWNDVRLERLEEELRVRREQGGTEAGLKEVQTFTKLDLHTPPFVDVLSDSEAQRAALEDKQRVLITYPGPAGEFFADEFAEDSFVAFMAPAKGKKSFWLLDIAWRAMRQGRQVAYFQVGDLSTNQVMRRFHRRAICRPLKASSIRWPVSIIAPQGRDGLPIVEWESREFPEDMDWGVAQRAYKRIAGKTGGRIRLSRHATKAIATAGIRNILEAWDREGWVASVVVVDYAGNLAADDIRANPVDQVSHTWAMLRQISELRKCLVVTAQQSNKEGFRAWVLTRSHFAESKMILAHVSAFFGINCTPEEHGQGIIRINTVESREGCRAETNCLYCASALALAQPAVVSCLLQPR